jgi:hypothetical protein
MSVTSDVVGPCSAAFRRGTPSARAAVLLAVLLSACSDAAVQTAGRGAAALGRLSILVGGLPAGANGVITVSSAQGYRRELTGPDVLADLVPGTYLIAASPVVVDRDRYDAAPAAQTIVVTAGAPGVGVVSYAIATVRLQLTVAGVPSSADAAIMVSGPAGYLHASPATELLAGLAPGTYTIDASSIADGDTTYLPAPAHQAVALLPGDATPVAVTYAPSDRATTLNIWVDGLYLTQATQRYDGTVPLVAGRNAYLRVFVRANQANTARPDVRVRLYSGPALVETVSIPASSPSVPTEVDEGALGRSWNVELAGALVQPGLRVLADLDPASLIAEVDRADNRFPASRSPQPVDVRALPSWDVRFVPVIQQVNGLQGNVAATSMEAFLGDPRAMLPVADYSAELRAPYTTTAPALQSNNANRAWNTVLSELLALRVAEASPRYYYGVVRTDYAGGTVGLGYVGGAARAAMGWDRLPGAGNVMAHEEGHNMGRQHAPCGGAGYPDLAFPYPGGMIGVWGLDLRSLSPKPPATTPDLMGYCSGSWISDFDWCAMIGYRGAGPSNSGGTEAVAGPGLLVWGRITEEGVLLEPAFRVDAVPGTGQVPGPFRLELRAGDGALLRSVGFDAAEVADLPGAVDRHFAFVVPLDDLEERRLSSIGVRAGARGTTRLVSAAAGDPETSVAKLPSGESELRWNEARYPMVLVRDAATREILSFARGGSLRLASGAVGLDLLFSDGVRSPVRQIRVLR